MWADVRPNGHLSKFSGQISAAWTVVPSSAGALGAVVSITEERTNMNLTKMMLVPAFALGLLTVGCGDDCVSSCEDGKECSNATAEQKAQDCDKLCEDGEKDAETMGCEDEYGDMTSCMSDLDDICTFDPTKDC